MPKARTHAEKQEIADAYRAGMELDEIHRAYTIGDGSLYAILKEFNVPLRQPQKAGYGHTTLTTNGRVAMTPPANGQKPAPKVTAAAPPQKREWYTREDAAHVCECTVAEISRLASAGKVYAEGDYVYLPYLVAALHRERFNVDLALEVLAEVEDVLTRPIDLPTVGLQNVDTRKLAMLRVSVRKLLGKG